MIPAMVLRIDDSSFLRYGPLSSTELQKHPSAECVSDTITTAAGSEVWKNRITRFYHQFKEKGMQWFWAFWNFIKYEVFFFFFDQKRDSEAILGKEIKQFCDLVGRISESDEGKKDLINKFQNLNPILQKRVKEEIALLIKDNRIRKSVEEIIQEPFFQFEYKNVNACVFWDACLRVASQLT